VTAEPCERHVLAVADAGVRRQHVTEHSGFRENRLRESRDGLLGAVLLEEADDAVQHHYGGDDGSVDEVAEKDGERRCSQQHHDERLEKLLGELAHPRCAPPLREDVGTVTVEALRGLRGREAVRRCSNGRERGVGVKGVLGSEGH
jgi:hypothetical protein